jgi:hypothetical protein
MKKHAAMAVAAALLICLASPVLAGGNEDDLKVIKRAVRGGPGDGPGKSVKWLKVLITDRKSGSETVKITLPISIAKIIARCTKDKHIHTCQGDVDIAAALKDLEELSPMTLLEIVDDDAIIKVWLE